MPDFSPKTFIDAFNDAVGKDATLSEGHKEQLDKLFEIIDAIHAEGTFRAVFTRGPGRTPQLDIARKEDNSRPITFQINFGYDSFSGSPTIALTVGANRSPVGNPDGYSLQYRNECDAFLEALGQEVAFRRNESAVADETMVYLLNKKPPPPI